MSDKSIKKSNETDNQPIDLDDFTGLLIHSYNNYLSSMMGYAELALMECEDENVGERLNKSLESGISAVEFGKTILASIGRLQTVRAPLNFKKWVASFIEKMQPDFEVNELYIQNLVPAKTQIMTDYAWFTECCIDLVRFLIAYDANANLTFTAELETLNSRTKSKNQPNTQIVISINSESAELDDKQIQWLFTPFYSSRILLGEKDIGLAKAKGFFEQTGSTIQWDNENGFTIEIPVSPTPL